MKETTDDHRTDLVRTIASDAEERGGAIVRYVSVAEGRVARLDAVPSDVLGVGASYLAKNAKTRLGGGLAVATSTVKPGSMESSVARWKHEVDQLASAFITKWAPGIAAAWNSVARHRMTPIVAFGALLALLTALALRLWQQRRWVSAMALGATVTLLAPGCDCTGKQGSGRNPRDASTLIAELPTDAVFYHGDWQGSPVATTDATGKVTSRTAYLPYGAERSRKGLGESSAAAKTEPWSYVGNERDFGSGLSNFHARSYRPELGRFLSVDPVALFQGEEVLKEPMRLEAYTYAGGEPVGRSDPSGLEPTKNQAGTADAFTEELGGHFGKSSSDQLSSLLDFAKSDFRLRFQLPDGWNPLDAVTLLVRSEKSEWATKSNNRFVYTTTAGWMDMAHFTHYAGVAAASRAEGATRYQAFRGALDEGLAQEYLYDGSVSRLSYEDLPSDYQGAYFGAYVYNPNSKVPLASQMKKYLESIGAGSPSDAPNFGELPETYRDSSRRGGSTVRNDTFRSVR